MNINLQDVEKFLNYLDHENFWIHIFSPARTENNKDKRQEVYSSFHNNKQQILNLCEKYNNKALICVALNSRDQNKTKADDVRQLNSIVIDIDVLKSRRINHISTEQDHKHAINKAYEIKKYLEKQNFKVSLIVDSGNGSQLYFKVNENINTVFKNTELYSKVVNLENELKEKFNDGIVEIDNITKDINRRIKIPGTINIKHVDQKENRLSKILYFDENYKQHSKTNKIQLNNISSTCEKKEIISNNDFLDKFQDLLNSHNYFKDLYNNKLTKTKFNNDRSRAEFTFLIWLVDFFDDFKEVDKIMTFSKIGKWKEDSYTTKRLNFENAKKRLQHNKEERDKDDLELWTPLDFKNLKEDDSFLIKDVIYPKTTTMIYSPPGEFKSIICIHMAVCVAAGKPWMNFETEQSPVLFCDKENNDQINKERVLGIIKGENESLEIPLRFLRREGDLLDPNFVEKFRKKIIEYNIKLVFLDTIHRFANYDENSSNDINKFYVDVLQPLIEETGISIIFLHHTTKDGKYRGSGDFLGMVDTSYSVKRNKSRQKKDTKFQIINEKSRSGEIDVINGEIDFILNERNKLDEIIISPIKNGKKEVIKDTVFNQILNKIKTLIKPGEEIQKKDFIERLNNENFEFSPNTLRPVLKWCVDKGIFLKDHKHKYSLPTYTNPTEEIQKNTLDDVEIVDLT
ncbi:MAG: AAA family ATPase [Nanoarchaeota archaeon]|nr:AAA family ATPase [Nanoarchaeota archaeon]